MRYEHTAVESTAEIRSAHVDIDGRAVATIRRILEDRGTSGNEAVAWVAEWVTDEKPLQYVEGHPQVAIGVINRETDKAWEFDQPSPDRDAVWLPKSQARMFTLSEGATAVESSQRTLGDV